MAELYCNDPTLALAVINAILEDGERAELLAVLRQLAHAKIWAQTPLKSPIG